MDGVGGYSSCWHDVSAISSHTWKVKGCWFMSNYITEWSLPFSHCLFNLTIVAFEQAPCHDSIVLFQVNFLCQIYCGTHGQSVLFEQNLYSLFTISSKCSVVNCLLMPWECFILETVHTLRGGCFVTLVMAVRPGALKYRLVSIICATLQSWSILLVRDINNCVSDLLGATLEGGDQLVPINLVWRSR